MIERNSNAHIAVQAALKAGAAIMEVYDSPDFGVEMKADKSPLTIADKKANDIINSYLLPTAIPIISEENKQTDYTIRKNWQQCWIVDPVDGTKEFIKRNGEFTVNIAMVRDGNPILGIIYVPVTKTLYVAELSNKTSFKAVLESHKTSLEDIIAKAVQLKPKTPGKAIEVVGSRSHMSPETMAYVTDLEKEGYQVTVVSKGSSLKFCLVAEGNADRYPRFAPTMEWDTAAGQAICNAVGVQVIAEDTKAPLLYNKKNLLNPWFICK